MALYFKNLTPSIERRGERALKPQGIKRIVAETCFFQLSKASPYIITPLRLLEAQSNICPDLRIRPGDDGVICRGFKWESDTDS